MSKTLLEIVQDVLNDMDSDPVNSIDDTVESGQVAAIVRSTCEYLLAQNNWARKKDLSNLTGLADLSAPTKMQIPDNLEEIEWIKYNKKDVTYLSPYDFKTLLFNREQLAGVVDANGYVLNRDPTYYTSYDDKYVYFDGYNSSVDTTLQTSKAVVYGTTTIGWTHSDGFIPPIPEKMFPTLIAEAKSACFLNLKQQANAKEENKAKRGRVMLQSEQARLKAKRHQTNSKVNYGRK